MTSKKPASSKRAAPPRACDYTKTFLKDWERLSRSGRYDLKRLKEAMLLLIGNDAPLGPEWLDHPLKGDWADHRECHIGGDFLLIYRLDGSAIIFVRATLHGVWATDVHEKYTQPWLTTCWRDNPHARVTPTPHSKNVGVKPHTRGTPPRSTHLKRLSALQAASKALDTRASGWGQQDQRLTSGRINQFISSIGRRAEITTRN